MCDNMDVFEELTMMTVNVSESPDSSKTDIGYIKLYIDGVRNNDLAKIYDFITAVERGNLNRPNKKIIEIIDTAWTLDYSQMISILNQKKDVFTLACIGYSIDKEKQLHLLTSVDITNALLKYELMRQHVESYQIDKQIMTCCAQCISQIAVIDSEIFKFMIRNLQYKDNFFVVMGIAMNTLSRDALAVYASTIDLMASTSEYFDNVNGMLKMIKDENWDFVVGSMADTIYEHWNQILSKIKKEKYQKDIVLSAYINLVLYCYIIKFSTEETYFKELDRILTMSQNDLHNWYASLSTMEAGYFVNATQLYILHLVEQNLNWNWDSHKGIEGKLTKTCELLNSFHDFWKYSKSMIEPEKIFIWPYMDSPIHQDNVLT